MKTYKITAKASAPTLTLLEPLVSADSESDAIEKFIKATKKVLLEKYSGEAITGDDFIKIIDASGKELASYKDISATNRFTLKQIRQQKKYAPERVADYCGISKKELENIERGTNDISYKLLKELCELYRVKIDDVDLLFEPIIFTDDYLEQGSKLEEQLTDKGFTFDVATYTQLKEFTDALTEAGHLTPEQRYSVIEQLKTSFDMI